MSRVIDTAARGRLIRRYGDTVAAWIDGLPDVLAVLAARWDLTVTEHMAGGTGAAFLCTTATGSAVLKLSPDLDLVAREAQALTAWAATPAMVDLLDTDLARGALLLDALGPQARDPARVVPALHAADPAGFPPLTTHVDFLFDTVLPRLTGTYFAAEHRHARALAEDDITPVLLHGDMHAGNVLQGPRGPVAIDPQACAGDPAFDWVDLVADGYDLHGADVDLDRVGEWNIALSPFSCPWLPIGKSAATPEASH